MPKRKDSDKDKKKKKRSRGRPSLDSYSSPEELPDRIKSFCEMVAKKINPYVAGEKVGAGEQQVDSWLDNEVIQRCIATNIAEEQIQKIREDAKSHELELISLCNEAELEALRLAIRNFKEGKAPWNVINKYVQGVRFKLGMEVPGETETIEATEKTTRTLTLQQMLENIPKEETERSLKRTTRKPGRPSEKEHPISSPGNEAEEIIDAEIEEEEE